MSSKNDSDWRTAKDPKTGREYYYNRITKETTWNKVILLLSFFLSLSSLYFFIAS